ncbi:unnamed protein product [Chironomus riparius]|uniref:Fatty acyl-CoA reductase n=1 Tax=Chironomus riparius TaxID=315576 RepID=A0A9N9RP39_9DIPT|nr:unnamed protein product [Chironomus riparius]
MSELNSVQRFYKDKTIFITGGSGFMGKVLIEKLLYSCSEVKEIIVLMRPKRGKSVSQRKDDFTKLPCFRRTVEEKPEMMNKITIVNGEISLPHLGLCEEDLKYVIEKTEIIFHLAASLKLEATLRPNVLMNLTGTKNVIDVAKMTKNLLLMVHTSTAFCNVDHAVVDEKVYDFPQRPMDIIRMAEWMNEKAMANVQPEILSFHPNTYTYTKRLAEILVRDEFNESKLPLCIVRPSIVTPSFWEPVIGWVDSLNGPPGITVAAGKGVLRTILVNPNAHFEAIPVDMACNGLLMFAKKLGTDTEKPKEIPVCNITAHESSKVTYGYIFEQGEKLKFDIPFSQVMWYPNTRITQSKLYYAINVFLFQWIPAYFIDLLVLIFRQPRFMVKVQKKISQGMDALEFFTMNDWHFKSKNYIGLVGIQDREEWEMFLVDGRNVGNNDKYMLDSSMGIRRYCARDSIKTLRSAKITMYTLWVIDSMCKIFFFYWLIKTILTYSGLLDHATMFIHGVNDHFTTKFTST